MVITATLNPIPHGPNIVDSNGTPTQEMWWWMQALQNIVGQSQQAVNSFTLDAVTLSPSGGSVKMDIFLSGPLGAFILTATPVPVIIEAPIYSGPGGLIPPGSAPVLYFFNPGGYPPPVFATGAGGFTAEMNALQIVEDANTWSIYSFGYTGAEFTLRAFETGVHI